MCNSEFKFTVLKTIALTLSTLFACAPSIEERGAPPLATSTARMTGGLVDGELPISELAWTHPSADIIAQLIEAPAECLRTPQSADDQLHIDIGRAAFHSPLLFGGQAARLGLSCASCHRGGGDNPAFFIDGLSGAPGTADVTSAMFSKTREDGVFNPTPIPRLYNIADQSSFGVTAPKQSLNHFIESAVVDEFQGRPPPARIMEGLIRYISHLDASSCAQKFRPNSLEANMAFAHQTIGAAIKSSDESDLETADFLIASSRHQLGEIYARYSVNDLKESRAHLASLSRQLGEVRDMLEHDRQTAAQSLRMVQQELLQAKAVLLRDERLSYYDQDILKNGLTVMPKGSTSQASGAKLTAE